MTLRGHFWVLGGSVQIALLVVAIVASACHARRPTNSVRLVAERQSTINGTVRVTDEGAVRVMRFFPGGTRQTAIIKGKPHLLELEYSRAVVAMLAMVSKPRRALIVGLGGGAIPAFLRHHYPSLHVDVVDIDPAVVDLARTHFDFREDARMKAHVADGRRFVEEASGTWDLIILDAFSSSEIPRHLATRQFLQAVSAKLAVGGVVVANVWQPRHNPSYYDMRKTYRAVFKELHFVQVARGSDIFFAFNTPVGLNLRTLRRRSAAIGKRLKLGFDLEGYVRRGYFADTGALRGKVLEDRARR